MPQRAKVAIEKKIEIVRKCLENEVSIKAAGQEAGVNAATVALWIRLYETEGISGLQPNARNRQYSTETKMRAVLDYLGQEGSLREICKKYKIRSVKQLGEWLKVYNAHGDFNSVKQSGGGSYMKQGRDTTKEERLEIVKDCLASGKNYGEMALKYKVSYQQVRTWVLRYEGMGAAGLEDRRGKRKRDQTPRTELEAAQIEIERLKHQLYMTESVCQGDGSPDTLFSRSSRTPYPPISHLSFNISHLRLPSARTASSAARAVTFVAAF